MDKSVKRYFVTGVLLVAAFFLWTFMIRTVDVQPLGQNGTDIGLASLNCRFHELTGVNMTLYSVTDRLGLIPFAVCLVFAGIGAVQLFKRKNLFKVDPDILVLGVYYIAVILAYIFFEIVPVNYRPVLCNGVLEASYPSSTTLLVISVMLALIEQVRRRIAVSTAKLVIIIAAIAFIAFMVIGRLISGVHWLTDIIGGVLLSTGLFMIYKALVVSSEKV